MPSLTAKLLFTAASNKAKMLYDRITVTDAWYPNEGGNVRVADEVATRHSMASALQGILQFSGRAAGQRVGRHITQDRNSWMNQGKRTIDGGSGICTDCAAAAALEVCRSIDNFDFEFRVEIISTGRHAMVLVGREGNNIRSMETWGQDAFVIDVWYQNQFAKDRVAGAFWATDEHHPVADYLRNQQANLRIDVSVREPIRPWFG